MCVSKKQGFFIFKGMWVSKSDNHHHLSIINIIVFSIHNGLLMHVSAAEGLPAEAVLLHMLQFV